MRWLFLCALAACDVDVGGNCPPCTAAINASVDITLTSEQLNHATAMLCRDGLCATGTLEANYGNPIGQLRGIGNGVEVDIDVIGTAQVMTFVLSGAGSFFGDGPVDGDTYTATITGSDGTMLLGASGSVAHYTDAQPGCVELAACDSASVTLQ